MNSQLPAQKKLLEYISKVEQTVTPLASFGISNNCQELKKEIENAKLVIPVVGGFSAGKSTLLNSFLGEKGENHILPTAITAETSVPAELIYATEPKMEIIKLKGGKEDFANFADGFEYVKQQAAEIDRVKIFLNNENLKDIQPFILVDMPGFDSTVGQHQDAITNYMGEAAHFIFVNNVEDGTIHKSISQRLEQITNVYKKSFHFGLTKTDLKPSSDVEEVQENIKEILEEDYDYQGKVLTFDLDGAKNLKNLIEELVPDALFKSRFLDELTAQNQQLQNAIKTKLDSFELEDYQLQEAIAGVKETIKQTQEQSKKQQQELQRHIQQGEASNIATAVVTDLYNKVDYFANLGNNPEVLKTEINNAARQSLEMHLNTRLDSIKNAMQTDVKFALQNTLSNLNVPTDFSQQLSHSAVVPDYVNDNNMKHLVNAGVLALSFVPQLSAIMKIASPIILGVVNILGGLFSSQRVEAPQQDPKELLKNLLISKIIPDLQTQLNTRVAEIYKQQTGQFIEHFNQQIKANLEKEEKMLMNTLQNEQNKQAGSEEQKAKLQQAEMQLQQLLQTYLAN